MGCDQHLLPRPDARGNQFMPARQKALHRVFEAFREGKLLFWDVFIARIFSWITWVGFVQRWRTDIITAAPEFHLLFSILRCGFSFVEALQRPVMAFVQPPVALHGNPHEETRLA